MTNWNETMRWWGYYVLQKLPPYSYKEQYKGRLIFNIVLKTKGPFLVGIRWSMIQTHIEICEMHTIIATPRLR